MIAKGLLVCAHALFIQSVLSQCLPPLSPYLANPGCAPSLEFTPTSGGGLIVTSASPIPPVGISIASENVYEGVLSVAGSLPFVGTTAMEGWLPTAGSGAINHGCGNGITAMSSLSAYSTPASVAVPVVAAPIIAPVLPYNNIAAPIISPVLPFNNIAAPAYDIYSNGLCPGEIEFTATSGGSLPVSSASLIPPTGISVASETAYGGDLAVAGELPFVGTVAFENVLPTVGSGAVNHQCGNGINAMASGPAAYGAGIAPAAYGAGIAPAAYGVGIAPAIAPCSAGYGVGYNAYNYVI